MGFQHHSLSTATGPRYGIGTGRSHQRGAAAVPLSRKYARLKCEIGIVGSATDVARKKDDYARAMIAGGYVAHPETVPISGCQEPVEPPIPWATRTLNSINFIPTTRLKNWPSPRWKQLSVLSLNDMRCVAVWLLRSGS